jgi:multiple sugar transport system ATP-binding protein
MQRSVPVRGERMASIIIEKMSKTYENGFNAVQELDLKIADGEFMVLVGPSGCGKTTALRMVAGLEAITGGILRIGDRVVNDVSPKDRDIAMVFQSYALYPHMTVGQNIGFSLKLRKLPKSVIKQKIAETTELVGLSAWIDEKPAKLSGGQRQRVAMGRAIVREPSAFLMDEPLSNLDAKLRVQMRTEVARIQRRLGVTTLYVTHDQVEAMTMGDRVAVLRDGILQQCGESQSLYETPKNLFVAAFIGSPSMNLFAATIEEGGRAVKLGSQRITLTDEVHTTRPALRSYANRAVVLGIRPEDLPLASDETSRGATTVLEGQVEGVEALGAEILVHFTIDAERVESEGTREPDAEGLSAGATSFDGEGVARVMPRSQLTVGKSARFSLDPLRLHFFDPKLGHAIAQ